MNKAEVCPVWGKKVVCIAIFPHLYTPSYLQVQCNPPLQHLHSGFRDGVCHVMVTAVAERNPDLTLFTRQTFCYNPSVVARDSKIPVIASDLGQSYPDEKKWSFLSYFSEKINFWLLNLLLPNLSTVPSGYQLVPLYFLVTSLFKITFWLSACSTVPSGYQLAPHYLIVTNLFHGTFWLWTCSMFHCTC